MMLNSEGRLGGQRGFKLYRAELTPWIKHHAQIRPGFLLNDAYTNFFGGGTRLPRFNFPNDAYASRFKKYHDAYTRGGGQVPMVHPLDIRRDSSVIANVSPSSPSFPRHFPVIPPSPPPSLPRHPPP